MSSARNTSWRSLPLWNHQRLAIDTISKYLEMSGQQSALIRMPTGTGKTGVIATVARCLPAIRNVLVLTPWRGLRDQLERDIETRFWSNINVDPAPWPIRFVTVRPSTLEKDVKDASSKTIFLGTITALQAAHAGWPSDFAALQRHVDLVIVDEGHREPAPKWARAVRDLAKPMVLLTATPYRNDHKLFNVDEGFVYAYSHQQAVKEHFIREVVFHERDLARSPAAFVEELLRFRRNTFNRERPTAVSHHKVIVRCDTDGDVNEIASALHRHGESVVAIHERFEDDEYFTDTVPDPRTTDARFWVHQNKLIEGIDDPEFSLLAIYGKFTNARALVQQVGRVLRNPTGARHQTAHVLSNIADKQGAFWTGYRQYEADFERNPSRYQTQQQFFTVVRQQPDFEYVDRTYRKRFDIDGPDLYRAFKYPYAANVHVLPRRFDIDRLAKAIDEEWKAEDREIFRTERPDADTWVYIYVMSGNSPLLLDQSLTQYKIAFTFYRRRDNLLFFHDTEGNSCEYLSTAAQIVPPTRLQKLFAGRHSRLAHVSLMNMDLGRQSIRRRTVQAFSVSETAPGLADHIHFCSTASGYAGSHPKRLQRRYVGFTRGRVSDESAPSVDFDTYLLWIDRVTTALQHSTSTDTELFDRFADFVPPPDAPEPRNILFDLDDARELYRTRHKTPQRLDADDLCLEFGDRPGHVTWTLNGTPYDLKVTYDEERKRYVLESAKLERAYVRVEGKGSNLLGYLNKEQSFRVVPETPNVIYAHGRFYAPKLRIGGPERADKMDLFQILEPVARLADLNSEKFPARADRAGWTSKTVFGLIDSLGRGSELADAMAGIDILVCDDAGSNEMGDFIAADTKARRVLLIHAKAARETRLLSASAFADVCSQAVKNLDGLTPFSNTEPPNLGRWGLPWRAHWKEEEQVVTRRIRRGPTTPSAVWQRLRDLIRDPSSTREVWIVVGSTFSKAEFQNAARQSDPPPEVIQILCKLQSTWGSVASIGARLRIFCSS